MIERFGRQAYGDGDIIHVPYVRAGKWVFGTGLRATRPDGTLDPDVAREQRPFGVPPRAEREAAAIFTGMATALQQCGSAMGQVARLDQYYPDARHVDPYHVARKRALAGQVAPSTSVIVPQLLNPGACMDVQVIAATSDSGYTVAAPRDGLNVPATSGYAPHVRVGDMIFVAGQLARDATGNLAAEAQVPAGQAWNGTRIKLETGYLVRERLMPALAAAGSGMDLVLKAQAYLTHAEDLPLFWQAWSAAFDGRAPPTTIVPVPHPAFGTTAATVEVNLVAAHASAAGRVRDVECEVELPAPGMLPARAFDGVLFVAGLMGLDAGGIVGTRVHASTPFFHDAAAAQMRDILAKAGAIFAAAGTDLSQVTRALQFHVSLQDFRSAYLQWDGALRGAGLPFSAVEVNDALFAPGARLILDLWGHVAGA
jgi:enamine deaminase RidA (YjgF/YER057c/UK114 family)